MANRRDDTYLMLEKQKMLKQLNKENIARLQKEYETNIANTAYANTLVSKFIPLNKFDIGDYIVICRADERDKLTELFKTYLALPQNEVIMDLEQFFKDFNALTRKFFIRIERVCAIIEDNNTISYLIDSMLGLAPTRYPQDQLLPFIKRKALIEAVAERLVHMTVNNVKDLSVVALYGTNLKVSSELQLDINYKNIISVD